MQTWKKIGKALLFPHIAIMIILLPIAIVMTIYELAFAEEMTIRTYIAYALSAYTLTVWCFKIPWLIKFFKNFKNNNRYAVRWRDDVRLRVNISLYGSFFWNTAYAIFQLALGLYHGASWYYSLCGYYIFLSVMRFYLTRHTRKHNAGENLMGELKRYRFCGIVFLLINMALTAMMIIMISQDRAFRHHEITTIAMAAYTFTTLTVAIVNVIRYRKYKSPVYSASKAISLAAACVSMITLENTMLTTFNDGSMTAFTRRLFLALSGGAVSVFIIVMAIYMILTANKSLKEIENV